MLDRPTALQIAIPFIAKRETLQLRAYWDNGDWCIGYGHRGAKENGLTTPRGALELLKTDADQFAGYIQPHLPDQNPNQFAALISLSFNIGLGKKGEKDGFLVQKSGEPSTILSLIQNPPKPCCVGASFAETQKSYANALGAHQIAIGNEFLHWIYEGHLPISGLCTRRTLERKLYLTPYEPETKGS